MTFTKKERLGELELIRCHFAKVTYAYPRHKDNSSLLNELHVLQLIDGNCRITKWGEHYIMKQ